MVLGFVGAHLVRFALLVFLFALPVLGFPAIESQRIFRRGYLTDVFYYFALPIWAARIQRLILAAAAFCASWMFAGTAHRPPFLSSAGLPVWVQTLLTLALVDICGYWNHRWMHNNARLWPFHAVHHSSKELDWLSGLRFHPVNQSIGDCFPLIAVLVLAPTPRAVATAGLIMWICAMMEHVNVNWDFGPLRYVITNPVFHRWHHTHTHEGGNSNFAGLFPIIDIIFGTFYMPKGRYPEMFGVDNDDVPEGVWRQLIYPFRVKRELSSLPEDSHSKAASASGD